MSAAAHCLLAAAAAVSLATAAADAAPAAVAAVAPVATLAAVAAPAASNPAGLILHYKTTLHQGSADLNTPRGPFFIPDGQCSGVLDDALLCPNGKPAEGVKVVADDIMPYPRITISRDLQHATVIRPAPCAGEANVRLELACVY